MGGEVVRTILDEADERQLKEEKSAAKQVTRGCFCFKNEINASYTKPRDSTPVQRTLPRPIQTTA
jgi:hypothetical protein